MSAAQAWSGRRDPVSDARRYLLPLDVLVRRLCVTSHGCEEIAGADHSSVTVSHATAKR